MSEFPTRAQRIDPIRLQTLKLIEDAGRAAAVHEPDLTDFARQILAGRRQRDRYFDPMLFSNPAWDLLLGLFIADADGRRLSALDCCLASTVPQSVALRWLAYLKQEEMLSEQLDPSQPRRTYLCLSDQARLAITAYLSSLTSLGLGPDLVRPDTGPRRSPWTS